MSCLSALSSLHRPFPEGAPAARLRSTPSLSVSGRSPSVSSPPLSENQAHLIGTSRSVASFDSRIERASYAKSDGGIHQAVRGRDGRAAPPPTLPELRRSLPLDDRRPSAGSTPTGVLVPQTQLALRRRPRILVTGLRGPSHLRLAGRMIPIGLDAWPGRSCCGARSATRFSCVRAAPAP